MEPNWHQLNALEDLRKCTGKLLLWLIWIQKQGSYIGNTLEFIFSFLLKLKGAQGCFLRVWANERDFLCGQENILSKKTDIEKSSHTVPVNTDFHSDNVQVYNI